MLTIEKLNALNTTNFRIVVSILLAAFEVLLLTVGVTLLHWEPTVMQKSILYGIGIGLLLMMGLDVTQFIGKRFSAAEYVAAKNPTQPVNTAVQSQPSGDAPAAPTPPPAQVLTRADAERAAVVQAGGERGSE